MEAGLLVLSVELDCAIHGHMPIGLGVVLEDHLQGHALEAVTSGA